MKTFVLTSLIVLLSSNASLLAQNITISADSVQTLLCQKWEVDYALVDGMRIGQMPGATDMNYEFFTDKTFVLRGSKPNDQTKGVWSYNQKRKRIPLVMNGKSNTSIISLKQGELVMLVEPMDIQVVYKVRAK